MSAITTTSRLLIQRATTPAGIARFSTTRPALSNGASAAYPQAAPSGFSQLGANPRTRLWLAAGVFAVGFLDGAATVTYGPKFWGAAEAQTTPTSK